MSVLLMVVYISPDAASASSITAVLFSFMIAFCGVMQPASEMPTFWTFMYKLSPYTYFIQCFMAITLHDRPVVCKPQEFNVFQPPTALTCQQYAGPFVANTAGYLNNPNATSDCQYCQLSVGDDYLATLGIKYSYRWRNIGFICAYILFNVYAMGLLYYLFRVKIWTVPAWRFSRKPFSIA
jgi:ATP-binding cassette subfamily G (WHITE) protein 2 (SNQ2)